MYMFYNRKMHPAPGLIEAGAGVSQILFINGGKKW